VISFLLEVFKEYGFEASLFETGKYPSVLFKNSSGFSNYIVIESSNLVECSENTFYDLIYDSVSSLDSWKGKDLKNTILVIAHSNDEILSTDNSRDEEKLNLKIDLVQEHQLVEEDKYIFKKHIFSYTSYELNSLSAELLTIGPNSFKEFVRLKASDTKEFSNFKNNNEYLSWYGLLLKILIKLPFIEISSKGDFFYDVSKEINEGIKLSGLSSSRSFLSKFSIDDDVEDLLTLLEDYGHNETD
jgi:hypothetical protein